MENTAEHSENLAKTKYHHGDLKEALIAAVRKLVIEKGAENFSLADACRLAGVSTAAPYRHFQDKEEILTLIVTRAFDELGEASAQAIAAHGTGTMPGIIAMGKAYVQFAIERESLFRLMFGQDPALKEHQDVSDCGKACFSNVINEVSTYCQKHNIKGDPAKISLRLWTFVHGAASLLLDNDYQTVCPEVDQEFVDKMIEDSAPRLIHDTF